ncbi:MAG: ATP-binding protein [Chloroflexi bacterium]|nr:ATP-binding protein [Chloroflexota bacterium]
MTSAVGGAERLGIVVAGSLKEGLEVRLDPFVSIEEMKVGNYVAIQGERQRFFGMITDVSLGAINQQFTVTPPDVSDPFIAEVIAGTGTYGSLHVAPMLTMGASSLIEGPQPVKTVPAHFSKVGLASDQDMQQIFGNDDVKHIYIGNPLDMETKVCIDMERFVQRSNGVFGKSGTGKTFLARLLLIEMIQKDAAANLIFDMHNDYGWEASSESGHKVKALKPFFQSKVAIFTLDKENSMRRGVVIDEEVVIGYDAIEPDDIAMLRDTLGLTDNGVQACYRLASHYGDRKWLKAFLDINLKDVKDLAEDLGENAATLDALYRHLHPLRRLKFLQEEAPKNSVARILEFVGSGKNVVLEFGGYSNNLTAYVLVANVLTRRIYDRYRDMVEQAKSDADKPRPLVITIEEAHKFLNPQVAQQTIFGTIAREMRKYNVTLLVIDQRPSGIDEEVMSQIGTKIVCLLDNEKDIDAVLAGASGKSELKSVLAKLETKQQALVFGHAVPMPVVVKTREYGSPESYKRFGLKDADEVKKSGRADAKDLWG